MKPFEYITSDIWNSMTEIDQQSLITYLRLEGFYVHDRYIRFRISDGHCMMLDHVGDLYAISDPLYGGLNLSKEDVYEMVAMGMLV